MEPADIEEGGIEGIWGQILGVGGHVLLEALALRAAVDGLEFDRRAQAHKALVLLGSPIALILTPSFRPGVGFEESVHF